MENHFRSFLNSLPYHMQQITIIIVLLFHVVFRLIPRFVAIVCSLILRHSHFTTWPEKERLLFNNYGRGRPDVYRSVESGSSFLQQCSACSIIHLLLAQFLLSFAVSIVLLFLPAGMHFASQTLQMTVFESSLISKLSSTRLTIVLYLKL